MNQRPGDVSTCNYDLSTASLQSLGTGVKYEDPRFQLNLVQKKELASERPIIPSTKCERLAYYRAFTSTQSKTEIILPKSQNINRCENKTYFDDKYNVRIICYEIQEFTKLFKNQSHSIDGPFYVHKVTGEYFQVSQVAYYREQIDRIANSWDFSIFFIVWGFVQILQIHAWKRYFWKALHYSQWGINLVDLCTLGFLIVTHYSNMDPRPPARKRFALQRTRDFGYVSEFWIDPTTDCATMIISNALIYVFRGLLTIRVKIYCEGLLHTQMPDTQFNEKSWFYVWPIFWQQFYLGDIYSLLYTVFSMLCESLILVVTNLCITETVVYEWPKVKRWQVTVISTLIGIFIHCYTTIDTRAILWIYGKGIATLAELVFLYLLYPLGRLVDDYTFHYGMRPTKLKILSLRFVPVYYMFKIYVMFCSFLNVMSTESVGKANSHYIWSWFLMIIPIVVGILITMFKFLVVRRMPWSYLIRPVPKWGPRDFSVRQLRKQFDSRFHIDFEVPRLLSRYFLSKKETKVYKVDVRYDYQKRAHISKAVGFGEFNDEKKEKTS
ncbi:hypothetical protein PYW07_014200 [Mythimna separata]|uniref:Uncharacterized protein n=1 Tax=Mythimna separata TaxID=271217 RepID=A0AAD7Z0K6_MYTSE|nr:hypothetical protein PYW07_014200 [Mythimna separata]